MNNQAYIDAIKRQAVFVRQIDEKEEKIIEIDKKLSFLTESLTLEPLKPLEPPTLPPPSLKKISDDPVYKPYKKNQRIRLIFMTIALISIAIFLPVWIINRPNPLLGASIIVLLIAALIEFLDFLYRRSLFTKIEVKIAADNDKATRAYNAEISALQEEYNAVIDAHNAAVDSRKKVIALHKDGQAYIPEYTSEKEQLQQEIAALQAEAESVEGGLSYHYLNLHATTTILGYFEKGRVDSFKEAVNLFEKETEAAKKELYDWAHKREMERIARDKANAGSRAADKAAADERQHRAAMEQLARAQAADAKRAADAAQKAAEAAQKQAADQKRAADATQKQLEIQKQIERANRK
jgi:chemotaxis protein histidine kinase CheA